MTNRSRTRMCAAWVAGSALAALASAPALAQASPPAPTPPSAQAPAATPVSDAEILTVRYQSGRTARVRVISIQDERVRIESLILGGAMIVTKDLDEFAPGSRLRMLESVSERGVFESHFALARRAGEWRLLEHAGRHAQLALESLKGREDAPALEAQLRTWAAEALEAAVRRSVDAGELAYAQHCLRLLTTRVPEQRSEQALTELAALVDELERQLREIREAARARRNVDPNAKEHERQLEPIRELLALGERRLREAIAASSQTVKSTRLARSASEAYRAAWTSAQELVARSPGDSVLAEAAVEIGELAQTQIVRAALHAANALTVQSDYRGALAWVDEVLAIEPQHREALEMRRTVQLATAASGNLWGWGWIFPPSSGAAPSSD